MAERGWRMSSWQAFGVITVLAVAAVAALVLTAPPPPPGAPSGQGRPAGPRNSADSAAYVDSLFEAAERRMLDETMTLAQVASRADIPVDDLVAELHLPATISLTSPLRAILIEHRLTMKDVRDARRTVELRLGKGMPR
jgi:hypothetical protein